MPAVQEHAVFGRMVYAKVLRQAVITAPKTVALETAAGGSAGTEVAPAVAAGLDLTAAPADVIPAAAASACPLAEMRELAEVPDDRDGLLALVAEVAAESQSTLVFCG